MTTTIKECRWWLKGGLCAHKDAPRPRHSRCISAKCEVKEKEVKGQGDDTIRETVISQD